MTTPGHIELDRTVDSLHVGRRHRADLGDIDGLAASIERDGLLQPLTVSPDGVLICGARRLAAIKQLGWRTVNVWVRSGISDRLGHLLAEQDDNVLHKPLTALEAAALYRELKTLMAEDAARRQAATQFRSDNQPGTDGVGNFPAPSTPTGRASEQAAGMIPGGASYKTLDKIGYLEQAATDETLPEHVRAAAQRGLEQIDTGSPVHPIYETIRNHATPSATTPPAPARPMRRCIRPRPTPSPASNPLAGRSPPRPRNPTAPPRAGRWGTPPHPTPRTLTRSSMTRRRVGVRNCAPSNRLRWLVCGVRGCTCWAWTLLIVRRVAGSC
mgnify:CR=1 FL=1